MIPASFDYACPRSLPEAASLLMSAGGSAVVLAGGQSLLTRMKHRQVTPALLIDLKDVRELDFIHVGDRLRIGAMARQADVASHVAGTPWALLARAAEAAADPAVRNRGTLVGAICEADPGGDWLAAALALDATLDVLRGSKTHVMAAADLALGDGDLVTSATFPAPPPGTRGTYLKVKHPAIGWSVASVAVLGSLSEKGLDHLRIAVSGATARPVRMIDLEAALTGVDVADASSLDRAVNLHLGALQFRGDGYASAEYRRKRLALLIRDGLRQIADG
jgi:carbon-monoxide dehydrogenase medium subunit